MKRRAFTLVEMLVVIAVISLIAAILFPVFAQARRRGQQTTCLSNLRQLGQAALMYTQDNDDAFPWGGDPSDLDTDVWTHWHQGQYAEAVSTLRPLPDVMSAYVKTRELWRCPADTGFDMGGSFEDIPLSAHPSCYEAFGMSYGYTTLLPLEHQTISGVRAWSRLPPYSEHEPVQVPLLADHVGRWHGGEALSDGRLNMVMVDGHAISVSRGEASKLERIQFSLPTVPTP